MSELIVILVSFTALALTAVLYSFVMLPVIRLYVFRRLRGMDMMLADLNTSDTDSQARAREIISVMIYNLDRGPVLVRNNADVDYNIWVEIEELVKSTDSNIRNLETPLKGSVLIVFAANMAVKLAPVVFIIMLIVPALILADMMSIRLERFFRRHGQLVTT